DLVLCLTGKSGRHCMRRQVLNDCQVMVMGELTDLPEEGVQPLVTLTALDRVGGATGSGSPRLGQADIEAQDPRLASRARHQTPRSRSSTVAARSAASFSATGSTATTGAPSASLK